MEDQVAETALKFDPVVVDIELAKKHLQGIEYDLVAKIFPQVNVQQKEIAVTKQEKILIEKIKENMKLICQLEYLENNTPIEVSEINLQLILKYLSLQEKYFIPPFMSRLHLEKHTPLAVLVFINNFLNTEACSERVALCHLFTKLYQEYGIRRSSCVVDSHEIYGNVTCELTKVSIGVISERSDLDSAVDAFLSSSSDSSCFWRLQRIYVQESVYESFKEVLDIKTTLKGAKGTDNVELKRLCADLFVYDEKYLLVDYAGDNRAPLAGKHAIFVEAYRTNKELISLVGQEVRCVSLWSSDVAEANELAYSIPANLVWINDYGNFDGPPEISSILSSFLEASIKCSVPNKFYTSYNIWKTYSRDKRLDIIRDVLEREVILKSDGGDENVEGKTNGTDLLDKIANIKFNSVDVDDNKICVTLDYPAGIYVETGSDVEVIIHSLVVGNGVISQNVLSLPFYNELSRAGVPIIYNNELASESNTKEVNASIHRYRTKVVLTNFGTIFAN